MELNSIKEKIHKIIVENGLVPGGKIIEDTTDLKELGLDSMGIINFIVIIEEEYGFEFGVEDLMMDNFESVEKISQLVFNKLKADEK